MADISRLYDFQPNTIIESAKVDAELALLVATLNAHWNATGSVHGLGGSDGVVVGTKKAQSLSSKLFVHDWVVGTGTKGKVYYIDPSDSSINLASPDTPSIHKYELVFGTGVASEGAWGGVMTDVSGLGISAPANLYLGADGVVSEDMPASGAIVLCAKLLSATSFRIHFEVVEAR